MAENSQEAQEAQREAEEQQHEEEAEEQESEEQEGQEEEDQFQEVSSTMVEGWEYDREGEEIIVTFLNGREESYGCSPESWDEAKNTISPGKWMWDNVL